ncbi:hypothetical protein [Candidatus Phytoplasma sacchari]|nr:hypothetical protein [Candidatus Phytoplasma sacchari]
MDLYKLDIISYAFPEYQDTNIIKQTLNPLLSGLKCIFHNDQDRQFNNNHHIQILLK